MKVILTAEVKSLGKEGDIVDVARGYAQNYLLPRKLALEANPVNLAVLEQKKQALAARERRAQAEAEEIASRLEELTVKLSAKAGRDKKLFGSITSADIAEEIARLTGVTLDKHKIELAENIKTLGKYSVVINLHPGVQAKIRLEVSELKT